jgi:gamma-glutamyltranspeptidase/glutathione hydrolase
MGRGMGAVVAGHPETAQAGAEILERGGTAVDAAVAMVCTAAVAEPTLTSLAGGGFMLVAEPGREPVVLDCFVRAPGLGGHRHIAPWDVFSLDLGDTVLRYGIGPASVAVPCLVSGLVEAVERWGRLTMKQVVLPAIRRADCGIVVTAEQSRELQLCLPLLRSHPYAATTFVSRDMHAAREGQRIRQPALARALEHIAATQGRTMWDGVIASAILDWSDRHGGRIAREDLKACRPITRRPLHVRIGDTSIWTNPAPSYGGILVREILEHMHSKAGLGWVNTRGAPSDTQLQRLLMDAQLEVMAAHRRPPRTIPPAPGERVAQHGTRSGFDRSPHTTHVSAVDAQGMHASITSTVGYGSGEWLPEFGIQLNNMLAEYDHRIGWQPGCAIPSMMSPTMWNSPRTTVAIGSAGSDRIPAAVTHVCARAGAAHMPLAAAIAAPRGVFGGEVIEMEPGFEAGLHSNHPIRRWAAPDAYFGTSNGIMVRSSGVEAAGDPRRGCTALIVPA